jgi:hypothetical protein
MRFIQFSWVICSCLLAPGFGTFAHSSPATFFTLPFPQGRAFPLEVYEVEAKDVPALAAKGWNIFQSYGIKSTNNYDEYLSVLETNDVTGLVAIPCLGRKTSTSEWPATKVQPWIRNIAGN